MRTEEEILKKYRELANAYSLKIASNCVNATIKVIRGQLDLLEWVLESEVTND